MGNLKAKEDGIRVLLDGNPIYGETDIYFLFKSKEIQIDFISIKEEKNHFSRNEYSVSLENYNGSVIDIGTYQIISKIVTVAEDGKIINTKLTLKFKE